MNYPDGMTPAQYVVFTAFLCGCFFVVAMLMLAAALAQRLARHMWDKYRA